MKALLKNKKFVAAAITAIISTAVAVVVAKKPAGVEDMTELLAE